MVPSQGSAAVVLNPGVTVPGTVVVSGLAGVIAGGTAGWSLRALATGSERTHEDLLGPFAAVAVVIAGCALGLPVAAGSLRAGVLSVVPLVTFLLVFVPWNVFAFRYAGRSNLLSRSRVLAVGSVVIVLLLVYLSVAVGVLTPSQESYSSVLLVASTLLLGAVALSFVSSGLVLAAAYRNGNVPLASGVAVVFPVAVLVTGIQVVSLSDLLTRELLAGIHLLVTAGALPVAIGRYDVLSTRPGMATLAERTVIEDLSEAVLVVNRDGAIIRSNRRAERLFGAGLGGRDLADVVGTDISALRESSTLGCWTERGYKRFDPRASTVTGGHDRLLGTAVTLIDVTDQEMLRQRVEVLNRIFRHNIRNDLDIIRSHADFALENGTEDKTTNSADESLVKILEVTEDVARLSAEARQVERLTRNAPTGESAVALPQLVDSVVDTVTRDRKDVSVTVSVPTVELLVNPELLRFALRNLVDNAVKHNDNPSPHVEVEVTERDSGVRVVVTDNGPGIPDAEWQVIEAGGEEVHDHARSLGLWGIKWTVQMMGGELSRRDSDGGATVVIDLPRKSPVRSS